MRDSIHIVLTADQVDSRRRTDAVPAALEALADARTLLAFERTAGDEIQGLLDGPAAAVSALAALARERNWVIGVGIGEVEQPLPDSTRAARGGAYVAARAALEDARAGGERVQVRATSREEVARDVETVLLLLEPLIRERTDAAWAAVDLAEGRTQAEIGEALGISQSAVSRRLAGAHLELAERAAELATRLLCEAVSAPA